MSFKEEYKAAKASNTVLIDYPVKVEVLQPQGGFVHSVLTAVCGLAFRTLIVWWAVAVWFPEYGLTYWHLVLPVYAVRMLFGTAPVRRTFKVKNWTLKVR